MTRNELTALFLLCLMFIGMNHWRMVSRPDVNDFNEVITDMALVSAEYGHQSALNGHTVECLLFEVGQILEPTQ